MKKKISSLILSIVFLVMSVPFVNTAFAAEANTTDISDVKVVSISTVHENDDVIQRIPVKVWYQTHAYYNYGDYIPNAIYIEPTWVSGVLVSGWIYQIDIQYLTDSVYVQWGGNLTGQS